MKPLSWDSAVRFIRGFALTKTRPVAAKKPREPLRGVRRAGPDDVLARLTAVREKHVREVDALERELERLHASITSGTFPHASAGGNGDLEAAIARARELRNELQEKRLEVLRVERNIAREKQLRGTRDGAEAPREPASPAARAAVKPAQASVSDPERRRAVLRALREASFSDRSEELVVKRMAEGLMHGDPEVRREAVTNLASRPKPTLSLLLVAAEDSNERVRLAALSGLSGSKERAALELFRRALREKSSTVRLAALRGLAAADARQLGSSELMSTIEDPDPAVRRAAAALLGWRREGGRTPPSVLGALGFALYDDAEAVRLAAAEALGAAGDDRAVFALIRALNDPAESVRAAAARSFASIIHDPPAIDRLPSKDRAAALRAWWREARVVERLPEGAGQTPGTTPRRAADVIAEIKTQLAEVTARAESADTLGLAPELGIAKSAKPAPMPEPEAEEENGEFESILGEDESGGTEEAAPQPVEAKPEPAAAGAKPAANPQPEFESVLGENAGDAEAADEEYESVLSEES